MVKFVKSCIKGRIEVELQCTQDGVDDNKIEIDVGDQVAEDQNNY